MPGGKAEQFSREVGESAGQYYEQFLAGDVAAQSAAFDRLAAYLGAQNIADLGNRVREEVSGLPALAELGTMGVDPTDEDAPAPEALFSTATYNLIEQARRRAANIREQYNRTTGQESVAAAAQIAEDALGRIWNNTRPNRMDPAIIDPVLERYLS